MRNTLELCDPSLLHLTSEHNEIQTSYLSILLLFNALQSYLYRSLRCINMLFIKINIFMHRRKRYTPSLIGLMLYLFNNIKELFTSIESLFKIL